MKPIYSPSGPRLRACLLYQIPVWLILVFFVPRSAAQWDISGTSTQSFGFDGTLTNVANGVFSAPSTPAAASPAAGQLDSDAWTISPNNSGLGSSNGVVSSGGWYSFLVSSGSRGIGAQPTSGFDAHSATLILRNTTGASISSLTVSCRLYANDSQGRNATISWSGSSGTGNALTETTDNIITNGTSTVNGWKYITRTLNITGLNIANNSTYSLTWSSNRGTGSGSSDEWALDNISVTAGSINMDGSIATGEYGTHTNGQNQETNTVITYMTWDNSNLYVGVSGASVSDGYILYLDKDPQLPVNGGTGANGTNAGFLYDNTNFAHLPFRADLVLYARNSLREYRVADGNNGWTSATVNFGAYGDNAQANNSGIKEFSIPWTVLGGLPSSFNWFGYSVSSSGLVYGETPLENEEGAIGTSARFQRYYTVTSTASGSSTLPFSRNSFVFNRSSDDLTVGSITAYDFTMNSNGMTLARLSSGGNWNIAGALRVFDGSLLFGQGGAGYGNTVASSLEINGGVLDMGETDKTFQVNGNVQLNGGVLELSENSGGNISLTGNWIRNGGSFTPHTNSVQFSGTSPQSIGGSLSTLFGPVTISNPAGVSLGANTSVSGELLLSSGLFDLGAYNLLLSPGSIITGASASRYVRTSGNGRLRQTVGSSNVLFPVGVTAYNPITLSNAGTSDVMSIRLSEGTVANTNAAKCVNRMWFLAEEVAGGSDLSVMCQYNAGEESAGFSAGVNPRIGYYGGSTWLQRDASASGSGPYTYSSVQSITSDDFSSATGYVAIGKDNAFIPDPAISVSPASLSFGYVPVGDTSAELFYSVSGSYLLPQNGTITVTPPTNFEISLSSGGGFGTDPIEIPYSSGTLGSTPVYVRFMPTAANTTYSATISHSGGGAAVTTLAVSGNTVILPFAIFDDFNRGPSFTVGVPPGGGGVAWTENQIAGESFRARIESNYLRLHGCTGTAGSTGSTGSESVVFDMNPVYATSFSSAEGTLVWAFNMRGSPSSPSGFGSNTYATAVVLGSDESDFRSSSADGYVVHIGNASSPDPVRLSYFTGGLTLNSNVTEIISSSETSPASYYSVRVSFNPCTNTWTLQVRNDGTTSFSDPGAGTFSAGSSAVNATHINKNLRYFGAFWQHSSSCLEHSLFDNFYIPTPLTVVNTYTWNGATNDYQSPSNWTPSRDCPRVNDVLQFNSSSPALSAVRNVPSQTVGKIIITDGRTVALSDVASDSSPSTLTFFGGSGSDLYIDSGSGLILDVASSNHSSDAMVLYLNSVATASIAGSIHFRNSNAGTAARPHQLFATSPGSAVIHSGGSVVAEDLSGNPFGNSGVSGVVIFESGALYESRDGGDPFALAQPLSRVIFETGSTYIHKQIQTPSLSGRKYADFEFELPGGASSLLFGSSSGSWEADEVIIRSGTLNLTGATNGLAVNAVIFGNLNVMSGATLNFSPVASSSLIFRGSDQQVIQGTGTLLLGAQLTIDLQNSSPIAPQVQLERNLAINGPVRFTSGLFDVNANELTFGSSSMYRNGTTESGQVTATSEGSALVFDNSSSLSIPSDAIEGSVYKMRINGSGGIVMGSSISISHELVMSSGNVDASVYTLELGSSVSDPGLLSYTSGIVIGKLKRWISVTDEQVLFPVGTPTVYRPAEVFFNQLNPGALTGQFIAQPGGTSGLPLLDGDFSVEHVFTEGYWSLEASDNLTSSDYDLRLSGNGFISFSQNEDARIVRRSVSSDWSLEGSHSNAIGAVARRESLSGFSEFAIATGRGCISGASALSLSEQIVCASEGVSSISVSPVGGSPSFDYQWFVNSIDDNQTGASLGAADGAQTGTYSPPASTPSGVYFLYCVISQEGSLCDSYTSTTSRLEIKPSPTAVISGSDVICAGDEAVLNVVLTGTGMMSGVISPGEIEFSGSAPGVTVAFVPLGSAVYTIGSLVDDNCPAVSADLTGVADIQVEMPVMWYKDMDGDGYSDGVSVLSCGQPQTGYYLAGQLTSISGDCLDSAPSRFPGATELCNGFDDDCDGLTDEGCAVPVNNQKSGATALAVYVLNSCQYKTGTVVNATPSPQSNSSVITGEDVWYRFVANEPGVRVVVNTESFDALIELQDGSGNTLEIENAVNGVGGEILNFYNPFSPLNSGSTYYVVVRNVNSSLGAGPFDICVRKIGDSGCNTGPGPYTTCNLMKVISTFANLYTVTFTNTTTLDQTVLTNSGGITNFQLTALLPGFSYLLDISSTYFLFDAAGNPETFVVTRMAACTISILPHGDVDLREFDQCPPIGNVRVRNAVVGANTWICGAHNYEWEFLPVSVSGLAFNVFGTPINRFLALGAVPQLVAGVKYDVRVRPMFGLGNVGGDWGEDVQCLQIAGPAGLIEEGANSDMGQVRKSAGGMEVSLYPNPLNEARLILSVNGGKVLNPNIRMFDSTGRKVMEIALPDLVNGVVELEIEANIPNGLYVVEMESEQEVIVKHLMVQR